MEIIFHRRNNLQSLLDTPTKYGVEIDIRSKGDELIISHDPYQNGEKFSEWIKYYNHGTLILNVKEEGLEEKIINYIHLYKIKSYFFLDQSFPFLIKTSSKGEMNCAVRISEYESIETALKLKGIINWVWIDMFEEFSFSFKDFTKLKSANFKLCLVSPELQINNKKNIKSIKNTLKERKILIDAVCTKKPESWLES